MATLLIPSSLFATCRVSLGRSRVVALAIAVAAACQAMLLGPSGIDPACGVMDGMRTRALRPGSV